jgi:histidine triad (HIT) family protein
METPDFYCREILTGRLPVEPIAETDRILAFHHTKPYWQTHIVIIPKKHIPSLASLQSDDMTILQEMLSIAANLCRKISEEHGGCRLSTNVGSYQTTKHLHLYIHSGRRLRNEDGTNVESPHV